MVNVFVYHSSDGIGRCLAALIADCDAARHQFDFLAVYSADSIRRMHGFLTQQGLEPTAVPLPFIVLVDEVAGKRSVLHGRLLHDWLTNLVDAYLGASSSTPCSIRDRILNPNLPPYVLRLLDYGVTPEAPPQSPPPPPPSIPPTPTRTPQGAGGAMVLDEDDATDDGDEAVLTTYASVPAKAGGRKPAGSAAAMMQDAAKAREQMVSGGGAARGKGGGRQ